MSVAWTDRYAPEWNPRDRCDADFLRARLETHAVIYIIDADRIRIALQLERAGEIVTWAGQGADMGLLLARRVAPILRALSRPVALVDDSTGDDGPGDDGKAPA